MPVYRYRWIGSTDLQLQELVPGAPSVDDQGTLLWDVDAPAPSKSDLDDIMLEKGFAFVEQDPAVSPDDAARALSVTAGENLLAGDLVALDSSSEAVRATALTASAAWRVVGVVQTDVLAGNTASLYLSESRAPVRFAVAPGGASNGEEVFLSTVTGVATVSAPLAPGTTLFSVGVLQGADGVTLTPEVLFQPHYYSQNP